MVLGRHVALTAAGVAGLLALLDVRPTERPAGPSPSRGQHTSESEAGSAPRNAVTNRDLARAKRRAGDSAERDLALVDPADTAAAEPGSRDVVRIAAGDGHRFGYAGTTGAPAHEALTDAVDRGAAVGTATGRGSGRPASWVWRADESVASVGGPHASAGSGGGTLELSRSPRGPEPEAAETGRSLRVTQTFAYVHGATQSASTSTGSAGGFEIPTEPEGEVDLGADTGATLDTVHRRSGRGPTADAHGGRGGRDPRGSAPRNPPSRAATRGAAD